MGKKRKRPYKSTASLDVPSERHTVLADRALTTHCHPVLSRYYRQVVTLRQFLLDALPSSSKARRRRIITAGKREGIDKLITDASNADGLAESRKKTSIDLARFLDSTLVGILKDVSPAELVDRQKEFAAFTQSDERSLLCTDTGPCDLQSDIVDYVLKKLFEQYKKPQHVLINGYTRMAQRHVDRGISAMSSNIPGIHSDIPNRHVAALKSSPWTDVLSFLGGSGDEIMCRLLFDCGLFACVDEEKATFRQISGTYLSELEPIDNEATARPNKSPRSIGAVATNSTSLVKLSKNPTDVLHKPNSILFVRRRMLYARPAINPRGDVRFGLKHIHVLNRFPNSSDLEQTIHVMKYMFPRQFGLHNVFTSAVDSRETVQPFKDYTLREEEIARLKDMQRSRHISMTSKVPKRLRGYPLQLVQKLQKRNQKCSYIELLKHYCPLSEAGPSKLAPVSSSPPDRSSQQLITQVSLPSQLTSENAQPSNDQKQCPNAEAPMGDGVRIASRKICLLDYATPTSSVSAFCRATVRKLIPGEFFGDGEDGLSNKRVLMSQVDRFIRISRFESLSLHEVCARFKIKCLRWLESPACTPSSDQAISLSDLRKRTEILYEFIYYIFDSLLIPLIRTNFYVTESQVHRNRLFYFRHDVWRRLTEKPMIDMKTSMYEEIRRDKVSRVLRLKKLSWGAVRLLPKATGTRPIINLRRRVAKRYGSHAGLGASTNFIMKPVFDMLSYEKEQNSELLGSSMSSINDMYPRLKMFKNHWIQSDSEKHRTGKLYFVKLDIQSCFDTIPQHSLVLLIESLVTEQEYLITKHVDIRPGDNYRHGKGQTPYLDTQRPIAKPTRKFFRQARGLSDLCNTDANVIHGIDSSKRNTIRTDTAGVEKHEVNGLLNLLSEHVQNNLVKIGKKYFRQKNGIPQGSVLSSLLCNFFYGELERKVLSFLKCDEVLLLRLIDDFLLITTRADLAKRFLQVMMDGQPAYGITVNASKSLVNFEATINGTKMPRLIGTTSFPYCGNLIDTHTLDIRKDRDYGRGGEVDVADTLTVDSSRLPGQAFHRKALFFIQLQTHSMFLDTKHNSLRTVLLAIYSSFVETAIKTYRYIHKMPPRLRPSQALVLQTIQDVIHFANKLIQSKRRQTRPSRFEIDRAGTNPVEPKFECAVSPNQIDYLGSAAFRYILIRKQTKFGATLQGLQRSLNRVKPRTDKEMIRMRSVIKEGNKLFENWKY